MAPHGSTLNCDCVVAWLSDATPLARLMRLASLKGVMSPSKARYRHQSPGIADLVDRHFVSQRPNELWMTDTPHPTREGKIYCTVVLVTFSRHVVGWSIYTSPAAAALTSNALGMAIESKSRTRCHHPFRSRPAVHGMGFQLAELALGLLPSMSSQIEVLDRKRWSTC